MDYQTGMDSHKLLQAVIAVYDRLDDDPRHKAGAEHWTLYAHPQAKHMVSLVRAEYKRLTGARCVIEPHVIADMYLRFRKSSAEKKAALRSDTSIPSTLVRIG